MRVPILCYHRIADLPAADRSRPYSVTPRAFARQIAGLAAQGYRTLDLTEVLAAPRAADQRCVALTFDDGYLEHYELAFPLLARYGFRATFFLVSGWWNQDGEATHLPVPLLSPSCVSEMSRSGMAFGSHGRTHRHLAGLDPASVRDEVAGSKEDLERVLGLPIRTFAYPYGIFDRGASEIVRACGYEVGVAVNNGTNDALTLRRIVVGVNDNPLTFAWKLWDRPLRLRERWNKSSLRQNLRGGWDDV